MCGKINMNDFLLQFKTDNYELRIEHCMFPGASLHNGWLPALNTNIIIQKLHIKADYRTTIEENAFNGTNFQNISILNLENRIVELKANCFEGLQHLDTLELSTEGNCLNSVAPGVLYAVPNLSTLKITQGINLDILNSFLQNISMHNLQTLIISNNDLKDLKSDILSDIPNLLTLDATHSNLKTVESTILQSPARMIQKVNFDNNELETLPAGIFDITAKRQSFEIILHNNNLKTLPEGIFNKAIRKSDRLTVQLAGNNWHCDCDLAWLQQLIRNDNISHDDPECESPQGYEGVRIEDADLSACTITTVPSTTLSSTQPTIETTTTDSTTLSAIKTTTTESSTSPAMGTTTTTNHNTTSSTLDTTTTDSPTSSTVDTITTDSPTSSTVETITNDSTTSSTVDTITTDSTTSSTVETTTNDSTTSSTVDNITTDSTTSSTVETITDDSTTSSEMGITTTEFSIPTTVETTTGSSYSTSTTDNVTNNFTTLPTTGSPGTYQEVNCTCTTCREDRIHILAKKNSEEPQFVSFNSIKSFEIAEDDHNKKLKVSIQADKEHVLIWMNTDDTNNIHCNYTYFRQKRDSLNTFSAEFETKPNTAYTMCAMSLEVTISPPNCRAHTTLPREGYRPWLLNNQQTMIWAIFCSALVVSLIIGGAIIYTAVRHNPRLIKGNKRVIVVGHRAGEVIVMPKEYSMANTEFRRMSETSYYTARTSRTSYVTAIQPTPVQLIAWKFHRMWDRLVANSEKECGNKSSSPKEPPPLPPYPKETTLGSSHEINFPRDCNSCYTSVV
jgi:hypothetical protein